MQKRKVKMGEKVRITGDTVGHGITIGTIVTLGQRNGINYLATEYSRWVGPNDFGPLEQTKEDIEGEIAELEAAISIARGKLDFMKKTGSHLYKETEYKVWAALQTLKGRKSEIDKARLIAKLIDGE